MAVWYCGSTNWTAVTAWAAATAYSIGDLRRQLAAPTVGNERVFRCTTAGTSGGTEPSWTLTKAGTTAEGPDTLVWTEVTGNATYGWTAAHARLANAFAWMAAGDTVYVSDNHAETQGATVTLTSPGTAASPCLVLCTDDTATPPTALAATGTVTVTGAFAMNFAGFAYVYGLAFSAAGNSNSADLNFTPTTPLWWRLENCILGLDGANTGQDLVFGVSSATADDQLIELINTVLRFTAAAQHFYSRGVRLRWQNTASAIAGTIPTVLFSPLGAFPGDVQLRGVDLSALGSGKSLVDVAGAAPHRFRFENCKLGASVAFTTGSFAGQGGVEVEFVRCSSGATNYDYDRQNYQGTITHETTIVRTGGADDGTTPWSLKMVSSANSKYISPLVAEVICNPWNDTTGASKTATIEVVTDGVTLTDAEAWLEVEYLGNASFPVSSFVDDAAADILATAANQASSTVAWTTTGLASPVKQKLSVSFTPQMKGPIRAQVMLAKASTTMYVCPKVDIT